MPDLEPRLGGPATSRADGHVRSSTRLNVLVPGAVAPAQRPREGRARPSLARFGLCAGIRALPG
jgi:hypothetical protein